MRAALCTRYGPPDVLRVQDVADPVAGAHDVVIRIRATTVSVSDAYIRSGLPTAGRAMRLMLRLLVGFRRPRRSILGAVLAGEVEAVGRAVSRFRVGDRVWAYTHLRMGCYAERIRLRASARMLGPSPASLTDDEAAAIPYGGLLALHFLQQAKIQRGERVLVYGASGAIGTAATQIARHLGGVVTAVCGPANLELARSLAADTVLDYTADDLPPDARYDVVLDAVGRRRTSALKARLPHALTSQGRSLSVDDHTPSFERADLDTLRTMVDAGALRPVVDRRYALEQIVEAHRYVETGHKRGNVIVDCSGDRAGRSPSSA